MEPRKRASLPKVRTGCQTCKYVSGAQAVKLSGCAAADILPYEEPATRNVMKPTRPA